MPLPTDRILEYGRPKPGISASRVFAGVCGVSAAILGAGITLIGVINMIRALFLGSGPTRDRPRDAFFSFVDVLVGTTALVASIRWVRYAIRGPASAGGELPLQRTANRTFGAARRTTQR